MERWEREWVGTGMVLENSGADSRGGKKGKGRRDGKGGGEGMGEEGEETRAMEGETKGAMDAQQSAETKASLRKSSSYTYWVRNDMAGAAPPAVPKKLTADEVVVENGQQAHLGSLWNQAGTWEEKCLNSWAWNRVKELLKAVEPVKFEEGTARVAEVTRCSGDATLVTVRQKKRVGYTFEIEMKYEMNVTQGKEKKVVEGKMSVPEACYGELDDLQLEVNVSSTDVSDVAQRKKVTQALVSLFLPKVRGQLEQFEAELKER